MSVKYACRFCLSLSLLFATHVVSYAQPSQQPGLTLSGNWSYTVPATDVTEAGSDFSGTYTSAANQVQIGVSNKNNAEKNGYAWRVSARKMNATWDNTVAIYIRRTSDGAPATNRATTITDGTVYQQITDTDQYFFGGYRGSTGIAIQYELRGVSVVMPAQSYSTTVVYTVTSP